MVLGSPILGPDGYNWSLQCSANKSTNVILVPLDGSYILSKPYHFGSFNRISTQYIVY